MVKATTQSPVTGVLTSRPFNAVGWHANSVPVLSFQRLLWKSFDVSVFRGQTAHLQIVDRRNKGPWGHIAVDQIVQSDRPREDVCSRRTIKIGLGYGEDANRATKIFLKAIKDVDGVLMDPAPELLAEGLGDSTLNLTARFWVNQETHGLFDVHSAVVRTIKEVGEQEGIDLPYPIQTVRLERHQLETVEI